jgi:2-polyprenyl-6-methoxyphenol hydroxylase-like FAD-dependent oxidoreductase
MIMPGCITIAGGGLAGLTLGIALRQRGVPVTIWEAGHYPRHRVCGEFICGRGRETLAALGLNETLCRVNARQAATASFFAHTTASPVRSLPAPALCLSRFALDATLADQFRSLGGDLREGNRWQHSTLAEGIVQATGRRAQTRPEGWRWFGVKAHARNVELTADLEVHLAPNGYVGLCRLTGGIVNVCGLFRRQGDEAGLPERTEMLRGVAGSALRERLASAVFLAESVCAVGGLELRPQRAREVSECRIGDALTMIPPFTGNGMSMAFESAELAVEPLEHWSCGKASWSEACQSIASRCDQVFGRRLTWANRLHKMMFIGPLQPAIVHWLPRFKWSWNFLFSHTR